MFKAMFADNRGRTVQTEPASPSSPNCIFVVFRLLGVAHNLFNTPRLKNFSLRDDIRRR